MSGSSGRSGPPDDPLTGPKTRPSWLEIAGYAIRPRTLPLSLSPVVAGAALAWAGQGALRPDLTALAALSALAIQVGTNLHNDAADTLNRTDNADRLGPPRVSAQGWLSPGRVLALAHGAFAVAVACGAWLVWAGGWPILGIGLLSVLAGYAYSAGPWPISRGPLGEAFVVLFFGVVAVGGGAYLNGAPVDAATLLMGGVVGLPAAAVLLVNNTRDRAGDVRAGRRTLAIILGRERAVLAYGGFLGGALAGLPGVALLAPDLAGALFGLVSAPAAWRATRALCAARTGAAFNASLARTGRFQVILVLTSALGLVLF